MTDKPNVLILGGLNTCSRALAAFLVPLEGDSLVKNLRIVDKFTIHPPTTYLGPEFLKVLDKPNVEYHQANLTVPATITKVFEPLEGQEPFTHIFDFTGEVRYDRPDAIQIDHTAKLSYHIGLEAARRGVKAYVRLVHPYYETSLEKKAHPESDEVKPQGVRGMWWHEGQRMLAGIKGLNLVILRVGNVYGPYTLFGDVVTHIVIGLVYKFLDEEMKYMWDAKIRSNTVHCVDVAGASWALANWIAPLGREEADKKAGEVLHFANEKSKVKEFRAIGVDGLLDPSEKVTVPFFNLVDASDTTQKHLGQTIANVFGIKFSFYGTIANALAGLNFDDVVEEINEKHMDAWTKIITTSDPPVPNTPLSAYTDAHTLTKFSVAYSNAKILATDGAGVGYKLLRPKFDEEAVKEVVEKFKEEGIWPKTNLI